MTAAIVFVIGQQLFPVKPKQPPPAPAPVADGRRRPPPTPACRPPRLPLLAATRAPAGAAAGADAGKAGAAEKAPETEKEPDSRKDAAGRTDGRVRGRAPERKPPTSRSQADKDLAREAWRRNRPDVSVSGSKTAIMIPIKGSIKGADFKIIDKRRKVIVTLPKAVSMVTLRVYNLKHPSFKKVWIDQDEANAQPADGTKLRFILSQIIRSAGRDHRRLRARDDPPSRTERRCRAREARRPRREARQRPHRKAHRASAFRRTPQRPPRNPETDARARAVRDRLTGLIPY